jgi:hypothetical protein
MIRTVSSSISAAFAVCSPYTLASPSGCMTVQNNNINQAASVHNIKTGIK